VLKVVHRQVHSWLLHECREMGGEIPLGARFADVCTRCASGDVEAGDEGTGAVAGVLELAPFDAPGPDGQGRGDAFEGLDAGHLVDAEGWDTSGGTLGGEPIGLANVMALLGELRIGLGVEPPAHTMGFEVDIFLKCAQPSAARQRGRCRV